MKKVLLSTLLLWGSLALEAQDITTNLIAHYKFNGNANDATSNSNHGTNSGATLTRNRNNEENYAYDFNGLNNSVIIPNNPIISSVAENVTISLWAYIREYDYAIDGKSYAVLVCKANNENKADYRIAITANSFALINNGKIGVVNSNEIIPSLEWVHLACTISNTSAKVFINGKKVGEAILSGTYGLEKNSPLTLGRDDAGGIEYFGGKLDDIRIYSRALTELEVETIYNTEDFAPSTPPNQDLIAYYPFDGDLNDYSNNGNHGTSSGGNFSSDLNNKVSSAYEFNGMSDHIIVNNSTSLKSPTRFITMATWAKIRSFTKAIDNNYYSVLFCKSESSGDAQYRLAITPTGISVINNGKLGTITGGPSNTGIEWTHFAAVIEDSLLTYYRNGVLIGSMVLPLSFTLNKENKLMIGRDDPGGLEFFNGYLDDTRIYSRKLTSSEIAQLYTQKTNTLIKDNISNSLTFNVYPNPFKNQVSIEFNELKNNTSVRLFDLPGREIEIQTIQSGNRLIIEPKTTISAGSYVIVCSNENGTKSQIIISE
ncbi:MAG: LamG-like jellyroll fold domain-containing protein [Bacteroidia bacterium]